MTGYAVVFQLVPSHPWCSTADRRCAPLPDPRQGSHDPGPDQPENATWRITASAVAAAIFVENAFCRFKDFRRVAARYDKLTANFLSVAALAAIIAFWV
jgi:hypothetical protein